MNLRALLPEFVSVCSHGRVVLLLFWLWGSSAFAQPAPTYSLHWVRGEGAEQCASGQLLARTLEQRLGPVLHAASEAKLAIEGVVTQPEPGKFELRLRVLTPAGEVLGERSMQRAASDCAELTPPIVLILALTLDPDAAGGFPSELLARISNVEDPESVLLVDLENQEPMASAGVVATEQSRSPQASPSLQAESISSADTSPAVDTPKPARNPMESSLQAGAAGALGFLPQVAAGASLTFELVTPRRLSLAFNAQYWAPSPAQIQSFRQQKHVDFSAVQTQLSLCLPMLAKSAFQLRGCAGGALGMRMVDASELRNPATAWRVYGGPSAGLSLRYALSSRWFAVLDLRAAVLLRPDWFTYRDMLDKPQTLYRPSLIAGWSSLGVGIRL